MSFHFRSTKGEFERTAVPNPEAVNKLGRALAGLPAPWRVLRNRRANAADGPPWVNYIVLHPAKGLALVDLLPAHPRAAIAPLHRILARPEFTIFAQGVPAIVAVALAERDIPAAGDRLSEAFAGLPPCGIKNVNWTEAVAELLMSTPGFLLGPIGKTADGRARDGGSLIGDRRPAAPERAAPFLSMPLPRTAKPVETPPPAAPLRRREPSPPLEPEGRRLEGPDLALRVGRAPATEPYERRGIPLALWLAAALLAAGAAVGSLYLLAGPSATPPTVEAGPGPADSVPKLPAAAAAPSAALPPSPMPSRPAPLPEPSATSSAPAAGAGSPPGSDRHAGEEAAIDKAAKARAGAGNDLRRPRERQVPETQAKPQRGPSGATGGFLPPPVGDDTVTIDGTTYIKGREPQALGTVDAPAPPRQPAPGVAPAP